MGLSQRHNVATFSHRFVTSYGRLLLITNTRRTNRSTATRSMASVIKCQQVANGEYHRGRRVMLRRQLENGSHINNGPVNRSAVRQHGRRDGQGQPPLNRPSTVGHWLEWPGIGQRRKCRRISSDEYVINVRRWRRRHDCSIGLRGEGTLNRWGTLTCTLATVVASVNIRVMP